MASINFATREITSRIVYFGPTGAGCNTNVERLWTLVDARRRSALHRFGPSSEEERSWYFDFVPEGEAPVPGFAQCWQLYSLPGGIDVPAHRAEVMRGLDAVVFVADARHDRTQANLDHLLSLEALLAELGQELASTPVVLQVNHGDAVHARSTSQVTFDLNPYDFPVVEAVAKEGAGVRATLDTVATAVLKRLRATLAGEDELLLTAEHADGVSDVEVVRRHVAEVQAALDRTPETVDEVDEPGLRGGDGPATEGPVVEVAFQPREFVGSHPVRVGAAELVGDRVHVRVEMQRMGGGDTRGLLVALVNRPADEQPIPAPSGPPSLAPAPTPPDSVFDYLPEEDAIAGTHASDLPAHWYGVLGIGGGLIIGLLSAYLLGIVA